MLSRFSILCAVTALFASLALAQPSPPSGQSTASLATPTLTLPDALRYAIEHNPAIAQARERIREQQGVVLEVRAQQIPNLALSGDISANDRDLSAGFPAQNRNWGMGVVASQLLYSGGGALASSRSARLAVQAAELELQAIVNEALLSVRTLFYGALLAKEQVAVQEENLKLLEEQLKDVQSRFAAGSVSNFEVLRAQVALANGQPDLITARNDYRLAIEELRRALGVPRAATSALTSATTPAQGATSLPPLAGELALEGTPAQTVDEASLMASLSAARANRPELQRLSKLAQVGENQVVAARSGYLPRLSAFGRYDWQRGGPSTGWSDRRDGWTAGLQTQWAVFDGRATAGRSAQAKSRLVQTRLALEETELAIDVEVRRAHSSLTEASELVSASAKVVEQADEALRLARVRYAAGTATQLDVLTSQVELTRARLNQWQSVYRYNVALAALRQATGTPDPLI